jgi:hypothetical protein
MNNAMKLWISRIFSGLITSAVVATAAMKIAQAPKTMVTTLTNAGIPERAVIPIALVELTCLTIYLIPRTRVLGAVLLTGYFGGAIAVHVIGHQNVFPPFFLGVIAWGGIFFRIPALPSLLPLQKERP